MNLPDGLLPPAWLWLGHAALLALALFAARRLPWRRLRDGEQLNVFLGACVVLMVLWRIKAGVAPGLNFHFLGATLATLMFGWRLALLAMAIVVAGVTLSGLGGWQAYSINALLMGALPVAVSHAIYRAAARRLPRHFFVYVFVAGFFGAAAAMAATGLASASLFVAAGTYGLGYLAEHYLPFYLLMVFPEAILTGSALALMVVYRPHWVATFDDDTYIKNK
ncbi:MAG TPA: energy-coupling factor ABC transporter permease [Acidiferrobacterales bacterium]|jgi:uncharacterized membrane protein